MGDSCALGAVVRRDATGAWVTGIASSVSAACESGVRIGTCGLAAGVSVGLEGNGDARTGGSGMAGSSFQSTSGSGSASLPAEPGDPKRPELGSSLIWISRVGRALSGCVGIGPITVSCVDVRAGGGLAPGSVVVVRVGTGSATRAGSGSGLRAGATFAGGGTTASSERSNSKAGISRVTPTIGFDKSIIGCSRVTTGADLGRSDERTVSGWKPG